MAPFPTCASSVSGGARADVCLFGGEQWELVHLRATRDLPLSRLLGRSHSGGANAVVVDPAALEGDLAGSEESSGEGETVVEQR
jgi:hypothetical protein